MSEVLENPFVVLGMAPTRDLVAVKRAWMQAAKRHPPNSDPAGFQKVRSAYEALSSPERLHAAYLAVPFDPAAAREELLAEDQAILQELQQALAADRAEKARLAQILQNPRVFASVMARWTVAQWRAAQS